MYPLHLASGSATAKRSYRTDTDIILFHVKTRAMERYDTEFEQEKKIRGQ